MAPSGGRQESWKNARKGPAPLAPRTRQRRRDSSSRPCAGRFRRLPRRLLPRRDHSGRIVRHRPRARGCDPVHGPNLGSSRRRRRFGRLLGSFDMHNAAAFALFIGLSVSSPPRRLMLVREQRRLVPGASARLRAEIAQPARRGGSRRAADGLGAAAPDQLERARRRAALRGRSVDRRRRSPAQTGARLRRLARAGRRGCRRGGARPLAPARRGLQPDRAHARPHALHRRRRPHRRRAGDPAPARRHGRPGRTPARRARSSRPRAAELTLADGAARYRSRIPLWIRDGDASLVWANQAYLQAVEATTSPTPRPVRLELLDTPTREEAHRPAQDRRGLRGARHGRGGRPAPRARRGRAPDRGRQRRHRRRRLRARGRPRRPAAADGRACCARSTSCRPPSRSSTPRRGSSSTTPPTSSSVEPRPRLPRLAADGQRDSRSPARRRASCPSRPISARWKADMLSGYRAVEARETWWHLPDRRTLRVVMNPNPQGGVTYLFDDVSERFQLESQVNALTRVQSETLDTLKEGVAVFGIGRAPQARQPRLRRDVATAGRSHRRSSRISTRSSRLPRRSAPQDEPWVDIRGAVAGLPDMRMGLACRIERRDGSRARLRRPAAARRRDPAHLHRRDRERERRARPDRAQRGAANAPRACATSSSTTSPTSCARRSPTSSASRSSSATRRSGPLNPRQREYADHIMRSSAALLAILNDILDLASIDTGSLELCRRSSTSARPSRRRCAASRTAWRNPRCTVEIDAPDDIGTFVADGKRVRQILFNLLSNAVGFSSPGQTIRGRGPQDATAR